MAIPASMAKAAAVAADSPRIMNTGSMRIDPKAMWDDDAQTGTKRLVHSLLRGTTER